MTVKKLKEKKGSALVIAILVIGLLAVIAISTTQTSRVETRIARNDRLYKTSFFQADGGVETGIVLVEEAIEERGLKTDCTSEPCAFDNVAIRYNTASDNSTRFYLNATPGSRIRPCDPVANPTGCTDTDGWRDVFYYSTGTQTVPTLVSGQKSCSDPNPPSNCVPVTQLKFGGDTSLSTGGAIQMIAGYEGKGKSSAGGGAWIVYAIRSRHQAMDNSDSTVACNWRHVM